MLWYTAIAACLLAAEAQASVVDLVAEGVLAPRGSELERWTRERGGHKLAMHRRQSTVSPSDAVASNASAAANLTVWDAEVTSACSSALTKLPASSNPSGTCICYNLPALNNVTGAFEADLRLYQLSEPTGDFAGIPPQNIQVSLSYNGASVSPVSAQTAQSKLISGRQAQASLKLLQSYMFVGQIDAAKMGGEWSINALEAAVMPTVTLSATNSAGLSVSTNVSSSEAAFVAGVFADDVVLSATALAQVAVNDIVAGLHNGTVAFVLPGQQILIFPIGLVVTMVWLLLGTVAVAIGTWERMNFRESFRRQISRQGKMGMGTI